MRPTDGEYYRQRAAAERQLASVAANLRIAMIHLELARRYEALVEEQRETLHLVA